MRIAVLANRASGTARDPEAIRASFLEAGVDAEVHEVAGPALAATARRLAGEGALVVAAGGDGTVAAVAQALAGTGCVMAVLPCGTRNHFARDAGIPLGHAEAVRAILAGPVRALDAGRAGGHVFVNNAVVGLYPHAVLEREDIEGQAKRRLPRAWAMARASWRVLRRLPRHRLHLSVDGEATVRTTPLLFIGNNAYDLTPGRIGRRADLSRGELWVYRLRTRSRRGLLLLGARAAVGLLRSARDFEAAAAHRVTLAGPRSVRLALDGEVHTVACPVEFTVEPGAILVRGAAAGSEVTA